MMWQAIKDLNLKLLSQSQICYHYTNRPYKFDLVEHDGLDYWAIRVSRIAVIIFIRYKY